MIDNRIARRLLVLGSIGLGGLALSGQRRNAPSKKQAREKEEEEVSPAEDLMREHGVLKRVLLIYEEAAGRLEGNKDLPPDVIPASAKLVRRFIEDYHERLEEEHLFPRFRKAGKLIDLVTALQQQHNAGRAVTDHILHMSGAGSLKQETDRRSLASQLLAFARMYAPHEAREDTVLFPAFRRIVSHNEYAALGEDFEKKEHELFGEEGFEKNVDEVAGLEKKLGIYDLSQFTPRV